MDESLDENKAAGAPSALNVELGKMKLTSTQRELLSRATKDWTALPGGFGCTNKSLEKLERLGLVETTLLGLITPGESMNRWRWRLVPNAPGEQPTANELNEG